MQTNLHLDDLSELTVSKLKTLLTSYILSGYVD